MQYCRMIGSHYQNIIQKNDNGRVKKLDERKKCSNVTWRKVKGCKEDHWENEWMKSENCVGWDRWKLPKPETNRNA